MLRWSAIVIRQQLAVDQTSSTASAADRQRSSAMGSVVPGLVWPARITTYRSAADRCTVVSPWRSIDARHAAKMGNNWRAFVNKNSIMPFALILQGRNVLAWARSAGGELWWRAWLSVFFCIFTANCSAYLRSPQLEGFSIISSYNGRGQLCIEQFRGNVDFSIII